MLFSNKSEKLGEESFSKIGVVFSFHKTREIDVICYFFFYLQIIP